MCDTETFDWQRTVTEKKVNMPAYKYQLDFPTRFHKEFTIQTDSHGCLVHPFIRITDNVSRTRPYAVSLPGGTLDTPICTNPDSVINILCAYFKRITPEMPLPDPLKIAELKIFVDKWMLKNLVPLPHRQTEERAYFTNWLAQNKSYNEKKKIRMMEIYNTLYPIQTSKANLREKDYYIKSFIKREFYEVIKVCRMINSRSDRFKMRVAPYIHEIEEQMYRIDNFIKHKQVTLLPRDLVKLKERRWILETDYSSFESGFSPQYTDVVECALWRYMLKNNEEALKDIMKVYYQSRSVGGRTIFRPRIEQLFGNKYHAKVVGSRMSGEMWTSLANGFSNLMNMLFFAEQKNLSIYGYVDGDDGIFCMDQPKIEEKQFTELGFKIKMNYGQNLSHTSFCGNVFDTDELLQLVPPEQIARLSWTCSSHYLSSGKVVKEALLRSKAQSLYCLGKHTPIAGKLALKMIQLLGPGRTTMEDQNVWWETQVMALEPNKNFQPVDITIKSRELYFERFRITIDDQVRIELQIENATTLEQLFIDYQFMDFAVPSMVICSHYY